MIRGTRVLLPALLVLAVPAHLTADETPARFAEHFHGRTLRAELFHSGDARSERFVLDRIVAEGSWGGSRVHLAPPFDRGRYRFELRNPATGEVLFRRGFDDIFGEYRTTGPARKGAVRTWTESIRFPEPVKPVRLVIEVRRPDLSFTLLFETTVDPTDPGIVRDPLPADVRVPARILGGDPHDSLDLAILGEGYTAGQEDLFRRDFEKAARTLLEQEPFRSLRGHINLYAVLRPSQESGCDEPQRGVWRRTALGCHFFSLGSPRYLLTDDDRALREVASVVPYDLAIVMVDHDRYGGGGIYGQYSVFTAHNRWAGYLLVHELGHALAGLADEYYSSSVAYTDLYPPGVEPAEPNITALLDPARLKWRDLLTPGVPIPTPWSRKAFDRIDGAYQKRRQALNRKIAEAMKAGEDAKAAALRAEAERLAVLEAERVHQLLSKDRWAGAVGAFEGAGYAAHGLYRPQVDCIMFSKGLKPFCAVCRRAIRATIGLYREDADSTGAAAGERR